MNIVAQNKPGIYEIQNTNNNKKYIGSSMNVQGRISHHLRLLGYGSHHNNHFQSAYKKYGKEAFVYKVLLYCEEFELLRYEQFFIDNKKPEYNKAPIAGRTAGTVHSKETREKMKWNANHRSASTLKKMSLAKKGKKASEETKRKMSEIHKGKKHNVTPEGHAVIVELNKKRIFTLDTLRKISFASSNRPPESIEKNRQAHLGKRASEETKKKMSASQRIRFDREKKEKEQTND